MATYKYQEWALAMGDRLFAMGAKNYPKTPVEGLNEDVIKALGGLNFGIYVSAALKDNHGQLLAYMSPTLGERVQKLAQEELTGAVEAYFRHWGVPPGAFTKAEVTKGFLMVSLDGSSGRYIMQDGYYVQ